MDDASPRADGTLGGGSAPAQVRGLLRSVTSDIVRTVEERPAPPSGRIRDRVVWGFAQPLLGLRIWATDPELRRRGLLPVLGLLAVCVAAALQADGGWGRRLAVAQATLLALAPVPSVLFAPSYARLAACAHERLGFGPARPHIKGLARYLWELVLQGGCVSLGVAPLVALAEAVPGVGRAWGWALGAAWGLHWIVVEGYDTGRVDPPGDGEPEAMHDEVSWIARACDGLGRRLGPLGRLVAGYGRFVDRLARPWRPEMALMERCGPESAGFGLATFALLAIPGLNLLFRPAVAVGAVHLRAHFDSPVEAGDGGLGRNRTDA
ncbi:MAG: hypothetical protein D6705_13315 [Deltaproteobacteria bacterium]|nr:MAG: hypothetical protein D6705_13315 [Deltaproteobacteria bacterium]